MLTREFVFSFREAAPYINAFRGKTFVITISGESLEQGYFVKVAQDICLLTTLGVRLVLVHGSRIQIDSLLEKQGIASQFHNNLRITDSQTMHVVKQAAGLTRYDIEASLSMGMPNSPMYGAHLRIASGNFFTAQPLGVLDGADMMYTGKIRRIDSTGIQERLDSGAMVLLTPIGYSPTGEAFNLIMEEVATEVAIALKAEKLIFMINGRGALTAEGTHQQTLTAEQAEELLQTTQQATDTAAYLPCAIQATRSGVSRAHLVSAQEDGALLTELFTHSGTGTLITRNSLVKIRPAQIEDIGAILGLIRPLEQRGVLVKRSLEYLEIDIPNYYLLERDQKIYGCVAMHIFNEACMAELACLVVDTEKRTTGYGEMLLQHVEKLAKQHQIKQLFVLTTQTAHWFMERGFIEKDIDVLPVEKRELYNFQRRSKVFIKAL